MIYGPQTYLQRLGELCVTLHVGAAARIMGVDAGGAYARAIRAKIELLPVAVATAPTDGEWIGAAMAEGELAGVNYKRILGGDRQAPVALARWKAFKRILDEYPNYSVAGLARTSGYHHSTVMYGIRRLEGMPTHREQSHSWAIYRKPAYLTGRAA